MGHPSAAVVVTGDALTDCLALADLEFAPEVCEPLAEPPQTAETVSPDQSSECVPGDDNCDGVLDEDESGWSCLEDGNGDCGSMTLDVWLKDCQTRFPDPDKQAICRSVGFGLADQGAIPRH